MRARAQRPLCHARPSVGISFYYTIYESSWLSPGKLIKNTPKVGLLLRGYGITKHFKRGTLRLKFRSPRRAGPCPPRRRSAALFLVQGRYILGYMEKGIQTPMARGRSTKNTLPQSQSHYRKVNPSLQKSIALGKSSYQLLFTGQRERVLH